VRWSSLFPVFLLVGLIGAPAALLAQSDPDPVITPARGFYPAHSYSISDIESIDAATGALSLRIPITELPPGPAGFTSGLSLVYNNKYWESYPVHDEAGTWYTLAVSSRGGWHLGLAPSLDVIWFDNDDSCPVTGLQFLLRIANPDGSSHALVKQGAASPRGTYCLDNFQNVTTSTVFYSIDGSFLQLTLQPPGQGQQWAPDVLSWTFSRNDGSTVEFSVADDKTYLRDRNGNTITVLRGIVEPGHNYEEMLDPFGRSIRIDHYLGDRAEITQTGHDGDTQNPLKWTVSYTFFPAFAPETDDYWCFEDLLHTQWVNACSFGTTPALVSSLELPNGLAYNFAYGSPVRYGELRQLTLPSGASVEYTYRLDANSNRAIYFDVLANWLKSKTITHDATAESWLYDYNSYGYFGALANSGTVTAPDGGVTQYEFQELSYYYPNPLGGILTKITQPDGSTLEREWALNFPFDLLSGWPNPWISTQTETRADSSGTPVAVFRQVFTSDKNGNVTSREERDSSALLRKTVTTYVNGAIDSANVTDSDPNAYSHAALTTPRDLVELEEVQDPQNPQAPVVYRSEFSYQESAPARMVGNLARRFDWDSTKPGAITPCGSPTVPGSCGLQLSAANAIQVQYAYTPHGNLLSESDPNGNAVAYIYNSIGGCPDTGADSSDLYQTTMQQGGVTSVLLQWSYAHNCVSGLREQVADPNGLLTVTTFDRYGRPTHRAEGDLRSTHVTYNDQQSWIIAQEDVAAPGDQRNLRVARFDQLGRLRLTQQLEQATTPAAAGADASLGIKVETRYQFSAGINAVLESNPYRGSDEPTNGWTATRRDTSGRMCSVETFVGSDLPDLAQDCMPTASAAATTSYAYDAAAAFTQKSITDPGGALRVFQSDLMGRLLAVIEDPVGANFTTTYTPTTCATT
jgi:YD repeat-containing protein